MPLYFAYGSNMESWQMISRCPSAKFVGKAILEGYRVTFSPDPGYLNQMVVGAQEHGLPEMYITMLKAIETTDGIKS